MVYTLSFFLFSKSRLFHNSNVFGSCIIHILYTGCAEIKTNNSGAERLMFLSVWPFCYGLSPFRHARLFEGSPRPHKHILQDVEPEGSQHPPTINRNSVNTGILASSREGNLQILRNLTIIPARYQLSVTSTQSGTVDKHRFAVTPQKRATHESSQRDTIQ